MRIRRLIAAALAASALSAAGAFASGLSVSSQTLASGSGAVSKCDSNPTWTYAFGKNTEGKVNALTISGIASSCAAGEISVGVGDGAGNSASSTSAETLSDCTVGTCTVTVPLGTTLLPSQVTQVTAVIVGP